MQFIPWAISALSALVAILTYARNGSTAKRAEENSIKEALLKANMKLDQVCATTSETRSDIKAQGKEVQMLDRRLVAVENQMKTVFKRLDKQEEHDND